MYINISKHIKIYQNISKYMKNVTNYQVMPYFLVLISWNSLPCTPWRGGNWGFPVPSALLGATTTEPNPPGWDPRKYHLIQRMLRWKIPQPRTPGAFLGLDSVPFEQEHTRCSAWIPPRQTHGKSSASILSTARVWCHTKETWLPQEFPLLTSHNFSAAGIWDNSSTQLPTPQKLAASLVSSGSGDYLAVGDLWKIGKIWKIGQNLHFPAGLAGNCLCCSKGCWGWWRVIPTHRDGKRWTGMKSCPAAALMPFKVHSSRVIISFSLFSYLRNHQEIYLEVTVMQICQRKTKYTWFLLFRFSHWYKNGYFCHKTCGYSPAVSNLLLPSRLIPLQGWVFWISGDGIILGRAQSGVTNPNSRWGREESVNENLLMLHTHREGKHPWESLESTSPFPHQNRDYATRHTAQWIIHPEIPIKGVLWAPVHESPVSRCWFPQCAQLERIHQIIPANSLAFSLFGAQVPVSI